MHTHAHIIFPAPGPLRASTAAAPPPSSPTLEASLSPVALDALDVSLPRGLAGAMAARWRVKAQTTVARAAMTSAAPTKTSTYPVVSSCCGVDPAPGTATAPGPDAVDVEENDAVGLADAADAVDDTVLETVPDAVPDGEAELVEDAVAVGLAEAVPDAVEVELDVPEAVPEALALAVPDGEAELVDEAVAVGLAEAVPDAVEVELDVPEAVDEAVAVGLAEAVPDAVEVELDVPEAVPDALALAVLVGVAVDVGSTW